MKKNVLLSVMLAVLILFNSCCTIITGSSQKINFQSNPPDAIVSVDGVKVCMTPSVIKVKRKSRVYEIKKDGYQDVVGSFTRRNNHVVWANIILLPMAFIGVIVDYATGSGYRVEKQINVDLKKK